MGILALGILLILMGANYLAPFLPNTVLGVLLIIVGAVLIVEHRTAIR